MSETAGKRLENGNGAAPAGAAPFDEPSEARVEYYFLRYRCVTDGSTNMSARAVAPLPV